MIGLSAALAGARLAAQAADGHDDSWPPRWELGPYGGVARHSLVGTHLGVTPDRNHYLYTAPDNPGSTAPCFCWGSTVRSVRITKLRCPTSRRADGADDR